MRTLIALGGNAILRPGDSGTIEEQGTRAHAALSHVAEIAADGREIVLTHGNGPIVGNIVMRNEAARGSIPPMPLYIDDADSQGGIGFLLERVLRNELRARGNDRQPVVVLTQVVVDGADPAFRAPDKPIGPVLDEDEAARLAREQDWYFLEGPDGVFRRVVPSPRPESIVECGSIARLAAAGDIVIACGGGGIPVEEAPDGELAGVDAIVDKDRSSSLLAREVEADLFVILMEADAVYLDWASEDRQRLRRASVAELRDHLAAGRFASGSMAPKIESACDFTEATGHETLICAAEHLALGLDGRVGTRIEV